jgi:cytosine/uracil/thiamine/allantoin permease
LGNYATLGLNIADFSRYANKPSAQNVQALVIPVIFSEFSVVCSRAYFANRLDQQLSLACLASSLPQHLNQYMAKFCGTPSISSVTGWIPDPTLAVLLPPSALLA